MKKTLIVLLMALLSLVLIVSCDDKITDSENTTPTKTYKVGDVIELGKNGEAAIEWIVLDVDTEGKTALLLSKDILITSVFDTSTNVYTKSFVRNFINGIDGEFVFFEKYGLKKDYMQTVSFSEDGEKTNKDDNGEDYLFLLPWTEASNTSYFADDAARVANLNGTGTWWWLRTSYKSSSGNENVCNVTRNGSINNTDEAKTKVSKEPNSQLGVRPAFWYKY